MLTFDVRLSVAIGLVGLLFLAACSAESSRSQGVTATEREDVPAELVDHLIKAQHAYRNQAYNNALALIDRVKRRVPNLPDVHFLEGQIYMQLRRTEQAEKAFQRVLSLDPGYQGAWLNMGINAYENDQFRKAVTYISNERNNFPTANVWVELGRTYEQLNQPDSAFYCFKRALALDSTKASAYVRIGKLHESNGEIDKAAEKTEKAVTLDPSNVNYQYILGSQLLQSGELSRATDLLRFVTKRRPWHVGAHQNLGQALALSGKEEEGRRYLLRADTLEQTNSRVEDLRTLARTYSRQPARWVDLGDALREVGDLDGAKDAYTTALHLAPRNIPLQNNVANLAADLGQTEEAIARYRAILQQDSSLAGVWQNLGVVYANMGRYREARHAWESGLEHNPSDATFEQFIGRLPSDVK